MWIMKKLKSETSVNIFLPALFTMAGLVVLLILLGQRAAWGFVAIVFLVYALFSFTAFIRSRNTGYLIAALFQFSGGLWVGGLHEGIFFIDETLLSLLAVATVVFLAWMQLLLFSRRFKWRGREILELAARPVEDVSDGFTERPRPLGKTSLMRKDIIEFARFASKHLIAVPYLESERVVFVPVTMARSFHYLYPWKGDYNDATWVAFDNDGRVSVNIARKDYQQYLDTLSFDQLCESLGNLFVDFMETYKRGEGVRIIDRMNDLRENPYT